MKKPGNKEETIDTFFEVLAYAVFFLFYILSIRSIVVSLNNSSKAGCILLGSIFFIVVALNWLKTSWSLYGFIATIPLISGLQIIGFMQGVSLLTFVFSSFYLSWLPKRLFYDKRLLLPKNKNGNIIDILAVIGFLSLIIKLSAYQTDFVFYKFWLPVSGQDDIFYNVEAAHILLQGLFFYRILELEISDLNARKNIIFLIYIQAIIIISFSLMQIFFHTPKLFWEKVGVYAPFDDVHSYASYVVVLFFIFWNFIYEGNRRYLILNGFILSCLLIFIIMAASKIAWVSVTVLGFVLLARKSSKKYVLLISSCILIILLYINLFTPQWLNGSLLDRIKNFSNITQYSKLSEFEVRTYLWHRAINMIRENPLTGTGIGTFFKTSTSYNPSNAISYAEWHENAHNYYLQIAAEIGLPALFLFLWIIFRTYKRGLKVLSQDTEAKPILEGMLFGLTAYLITCLTGHPLLLVSQQFSFWFVIAAVTIPYNLSKERISSNKSLIDFKIAAILLFVVLLANYGYKLYSDSLAPKKYEIGFYNFESFNGKAARWAMRKSVSSKAVEGKFLTFEVFAAPHNISRNGLNLKVFINNRLWDSVNFLTSGWKQMDYFIPFRKGELIELKMEVSKAFTPYKLGLSPDKRHLGVAMTEIKFADKMPQEGFGFYGQEERDNEIVSGWPENQPLKYRWTGMRASINLEDGLRNGSSALFLKCNHPDIGKEPVRVKIIGEDGLIQEETFTDNKWRKIQLTKDKLQHTGVLTFEVSRTWNPKLSGYSEDSRDLGVAVAVVPQAK